MGLLFLSVLVAALFSPWIFQGKVLAPFDLLQGLISPWNQHDFEAIPKVHNHFVSDAVTQYIPYALFSKASFASDGFVGWNPLVFGGVAQHANTMALSYDWTQALYRCLDFWPAWHLGRLCQFLIAGIGMFVFLRARGCAAGVALMAATAYLLNTQFVVWIYHQWALASFCWIPWLFWALYKIREGHVTHLVPGALFLSLCLSGGTLQHAAFVGLALFCLWLGWLGEGRRLGGRFVRATLPLFAVAIFGVTLVAPMLEATIHAYLENLRAGQLRGGLGYANGWSQPFLNLLTIPFYALPTVLGSPASLDLWKLFRSDLMNVASFGTLPVLFAFLGLFSRNVPLPARGLAAMGLLIPLSPLVGPLYHRVQLIWIFGGCWCAAAWLQHSGPAGLLKILRPLGIFGGVFIALWFAFSVVSLLTENRWEPFLQEKVLAHSGSSQFGIFTNWMQFRTKSLFPYLSIWNPVQMAYLIGLALTAAGLRSLFSQRGILWVVPAVGVGLQGLVCWWQWSTWSEVREEIYESTGWVKVLQKVVGMDGRLAQMPGGYASHPFGPNSLQPSGVAVAGGYDSIHPNGLTRPVVPWDFPGTTHFLGEKKGVYPNGWQAVHSDAIWCLWKNPAPTLGIVTLADGGQEPLREGTVRRPSFNTMKLIVPAGTVRVDLFSNAHRGWKWKEEHQDSWRFAEKGPGGVMVLRPDKPSNQNTALNLRYQPPTPAWVQGIQAAGAIILLSMAGFRLVRLWQARLAQ